MLRKKYKDKTGHICMHVRIYIHQCSWLWHYNYKDMLTQFAVRDARRDSLTSRLLWNAWLMNIVVRTYIHYICLPQKVIKTIQYTTSTIINYNCKNPVRNKGILFDCIFFFLQILPIHFTVVEQVGEDGNKCF